MSILRAGVIGFPIGHSLSPRIHRFWLDQYGIAGRYEAVLVAPDWLDDMVRSFRGSGWRGFNVTVPHKESIMSLLDRIDPVAARIGAVNTVVACDEHVLEGRNSDAGGFLANLQAVQPIDTKHPAAVLGAGGAGRAVVAALLGAGVKEVRLANRDRARAETLAETFPGVVVWDWDKRAAMLDGARLLANATSLGMAGQPPLDIALDALPRGAMVNDIVYRPLETKLLADARARGNIVVDGLGMLLYQAVEGFSAWFGVTPKVTPELRASVLAAIAAA